MFDEFNFEGPALILLIKDLLFWIKHIYLYLEF